jgi:hypothetical protein
MAMAELKVRNEGGRMTRSTSTPPEKATKRRLRAPASLLVGRTDL